MPTYDGATGDWERADPEGLPGRLVALRLSLLPPSRLDSDQAIVSRFVR